MCHRPLGEREYVRATEWPTKSMHIWPMGVHCARIEKWRNGTRNRQNERNNNTRSIDANANGSHFEMNKRKSNRDRTRTHIFAIEHPRRPRPRMY